MNIFSHRCAHFDIYTISICLHAVRIAQIMAFESPLILAMVIKIKLNGCRWSIIIRESVWLHFHQLSETKLSRWMANNNTAIRCQCLCGNPTVYRNIFFGVRAHTFQLDKLVPHLFSYHMIQWQFGCKDLIEISTWQRNSVCDTFSPEARI